MNVIVAFSSPKRSYDVVIAGAKFCQNNNAKMYLTRIIPDPNKVGVVAQLIASERPYDKALEQVENISQKLRNQNIDVEGVVRTGEVAKEIIKICAEFKADYLFLGTNKYTKPGLFFIQRDPIVRYLVDNCPVNLCLIRHVIDNDNAQKILDFKLG